MSRIPVQEMVIRKYDENTYKKYGLYVIQVNNGYKIRQDEDGYIFETLHKSKQKAQNFIDNMIRIFKQYEKKVYTR